MSSNPRRSKLMVVDPSTHDEPSKFTYWHPTAYKTNFTLVRYGCAQIGRLYRQGRRNLFGFHAVHVGPDTLAFRVYLLSGTITQVTLLTRLPTRRMRVRGVCTRARTGRWRSNSSMRKLAGRLLPSDLAPQRCTAPPTLLSRQCASRGRCCPGTPSVCKDGSGKVRGGAGVV